MQIQSPTHGKAQPFASVPLTVGMASVSLASCSHGSSPGMCSYCSGGGGGGGGSSSAAKKSSGLMSWNEAWATWNAIQVGKARQVDYLKGSELLRQQHQSELTRPASPVLQNLLNRLAQTAQSVIGFLTQPVSNLLRRIAPGLFAERLAKMPLTERVAATLNAVAERVSLLLGEMKTRLSETLTQVLESVTLFFTSLDIGQKLAELRQRMAIVFDSAIVLITAQIEFVQKNIKTLFQKVFRWLGQSDDDDEVPSADRQADEEASENDHPEPRFALR